MSLKKTAKDIRFCKKINRLKDFIVSPSGLFYLIAIILLISIIRHKKS